ncbi:hypothetical protein [Plantactinospora sp. KLBMP9567]|uniref:hypothetical protein n=1 Tax=Plantactinospora sp. KLBMP9567 TaxID=3085900 RepID=UPI002981AF1A|nr:hypothetical protein [Plantactinospora sp. KLBMP9567]MDW5322885.1 hypothetical protein [Plantactinospora sp. KLBMP9567]
MNPFTRLANKLRRPMRVEIAGPADQVAAALHGIAALVHRHGDKVGPRFRIDLTIREKSNGGQQ